MKATVYYPVLSKEQINTLNRVGWSDPVGRAYLETRGGRYEKAVELGLMVKAAEVEIATKDPEAIWVRLQNGIDVPSEAEIIDRFEFRSMDVGDVIVWENGTKERVASVGFEPADLTFG